MSVEFKLPDLGEGIHEGEVLAVLVKTGDPVKEGDPILEVETDKAAVEIPSPYTATVEEIRVKAGDVVNVGEVMMVFSGADTQAAPPGERTPAAPSTRRLARELDVDLKSVPPSGHGGIVTAEDVRAFAQGSQPVAEKAEAAPLESEEFAPLPLAVSAPALPDFSQWGPADRVPFKSIRRATARQMALAWSQIPHITIQEEVDITRLEEFRNRHKARVKAAGGRLTLTVFALKAAVTALKKFPRFNASLDPGAGEMVLKRYYHIGVATDTPEGLIVPALRDVDRKSIRELSLELGDLVDRTRNRKVRLEELQGGTFTITNIGNTAGGHFVPIINHPEVAIFGMGSARMKPAVVEDADGQYTIAPRLIMPIVLGMDHRVLDGADATRFIRTIVDVLRDPEEMLMEMV